MREESGDGAHGPIARRLMDWKGDDVGYFSFGIWLEEIIPVSIAGGDYGGGMWFFSLSSSLFLFFICCVNFMDDGMAS